MHWLQVLIADLGVAFGVACVAGIILAFATNGIIGAVGAAILFIAGARIAIKIAGGYRRVRDPIVSPNDASRPGAITGH